MPLGSKAGAAHKRFVGESHDRVSLGEPTGIGYIMVYTIWRSVMTQTAKLFMNGRSQAVRLPAEFRFEGKEVFIRRDPATGDVVLSQKEKTWDRFLATLKEGSIPEDFLSPEERRQSVDDNRDPFADWRE
jgi:antitoxin VapB